MATIENGSVMACHIETTEHCREIDRNFQTNQSFRRNKTRKPKAFFEHDNRLLSKNHHPRKFFPLDDSDDSESPIPYKSFVSHDFPNAKITFPRKGQKAMYMNSKMRRVVQFRKKNNRMKKRMGMQSAMCCCHCACFKKPNTGKVCNAKAVTHVVKGKHPRGMNRIKKAKFNGCKSFRYFKFESLLVFYQVGLKTFLKIVANSSGTHFRPRKCHEVQIGISFVFTRFCICLSRFSTL